MGISIWQIVLVLVIILILFGAGKIPRVMGDIAKGIKSFKAGMKEGEESEEIDDSSSSNESKKNPRKKSTTAKKWIVIFRWQNWLYNFLLVYIIFSSIY